MTKKIVKLGFIGAGKMGTAILKGIVESNFLSSENIFVYDKNKDAVDKIKASLNINPCDNVEDLAKSVDVILIATKPFVSDEVLNSIKDFIKDQLIISIMAGVSISKIENILKNAKVIRVMPNTPALVNKGMSAVCKGNYSTEDDANWVLELFSNLGSSVRIDEKYIDIVTAISGSGPAFFYYVIEEIARGGEKLGLDYETCLKLSAQTAIGAACMIEETDDTPSTLIKNVTTPGGCTEVGNNVLINSKVDEILHKTIKETMEKAKSLG